MAYLVHLITSRLIDIIFYCKQIVFKFGRAFIVVSVWWIHIIVRCLSEFLVSYLQRAPGYYYVFFFFESKLINVEFFSWLFIVFKNDSLSRPFCSVMNKVHYDNIIIITTYMYIIIYICRIQRQMTTPTSKITFSVWASELLLFLYYILYFLFVLRTSDNHVTRCCRTSRYFRRSVISWFIDQISYYKKYFDYQYCRSFVSILFDVWIFPSCDDLYIPVHSHKCNRICWHCCELTQHK